MAHTDINAQTDIRLEHVTTLEASVCMASRGPPHADRILDRASTQQENTYILQTKAARQCTGSYVSSIMILLKVGIAGGRPRHPKPEYTKDPKSAWEILGHGSRGPGTTMTSQLSLTKTIDWGPHASFVHLYTYTGILGPRYAQPRPLLDLGSCLRQRMQAQRPAWRCRPRD